MMRAKILGVCMFVLLMGGCTTSRLGKAEKLLEQKEYVQAIRTYLRMLDPHLRDGKRYIYYDREVIVGISNVYWNMQRYEMAIKILNMVVEKEPTYGKALFHLGLCYEGLGMEEDAIDVYHRYPYLSASDPYRQVLRGRLDWNIRRKVAREIQYALQNESQLDIDYFPENSVAVLYFLSVSDDPQWIPLQKGLAEMIITDLSQVEELTVIERLRLSKLMEELRLSASGLIEEDTAPRLGKLMGARYMVKGSYMVMEDLRMTLDTGIYESDKIYLPTSANFEGNLTRLFQIEKEIVLRILDYFGIELTPLQRERILRIPTQDMVAFISYCRGLDALDRDNFKLAREFFMEAVRLDNNFEMAKDYLMTDQVWNATHSQNLVRVYREVAQIIEEAPQGQAEVVYTPPEALVSTWYRLQWMGRYQNAGFLPGGETRKSFQEAEFYGAPVLPRRIGEPPAPGSTE